MIGQPDPIYLTTKGQLVEKLLTVGHLFKCLKLPPQNNRIMHFYVRMNFSSSPINKSTKTMSPKTMQSEMAVSKLCYGK